MVTNGTHNIYQISKALIPAGLGSGAGVILSILLIPFLIPILGFEVFSFFLLINSMVNFSGAAGLGCDRILKKEVYLLTQGTGNFINGVSFFAAYICLNILFAALIFFLQGSLPKSFQLNYFCSLFFLNSLFSCYKIVLEIQGNIKVISLGSIMVTQGAISLALFFYYAMDLADEQKFLELISFFRYFLGLFILVSVFKFFRPYLGRKYRTPTKRYLVNHFKAILRSFHFSFVENIDKILGIISISIVHMFPLGVLLDKFLMLPRILVGSAVALVIGKGFSQRKVFLLISCSLILSPVLCLFLFDQANEMIFHGELEFNWLAFCFFCSLGVSSVLLMFVYTFVDLNIFDLPSVYPQSDVISKLIILFLVVFEVATFEDALIALTVWQALFTVALFMFCCRSIYFEDGHEY